MSGVEWRRADIKTAVPAEITELNRLAMAFLNGNGQMPSDVDRRLNQMKGVLHMLEGMELVQRDRKDAMAKDGNLIEAKEGAFKPEVVQLTTDLRKLLGDQYVPFMHALLGERDAAKVRRQNEIVRAEDETRQRSFDEDTKLRLAAAQRTAVQPRPAQPADQPGRQEGAEVSKEERAMAALVVRIIDAYEDEKSLDAFVESMIRMFYGSRMVGTDSDSSMERLSQAIQRIVDYQKYAARPEYVGGAKKWKQIKDGTIINGLRFLKAKLQEQHLTVPASLQSLR